MYIEGVPAYLVKTANRPQIQFEEIVLDHINVKRYIKGKGAWQPVDVTLYDPVVPSGAQAVMEWVRLSHESVTGRDGYSDFYKKDVTFNMLGPVGDVVEEWILKGTYIETANFGGGRVTVSLPAGSDLSVVLDCLEHYHRIGFFTYCLLLA